MSRRFGRNQRRRLREEVESAKADAARFEAASTMNQALAAHMREELKEFRCAFEEIRECLGPHHILLGKAQPSQGRNFIEPSLLGHEITSDSKLRIVTVGIVEVAVRRDDVRRAIHAKLERDGVAVIYSLSDEAVNLLSPAQLELVIYKEVAPSIVKGFVREIKNRRS